MGEPVKQTVVHPVNHTNVPECAFSDVRPVELRCMTDFSIIVLPPMMIPARLDEFTIRDC